MIWTYFKIAFRRLQKSRLYTLINLVGLTVGISSCLLIGLFIINELSYDHFNQNADRIVRMTMQFGEGGKEKYATTGSKAGPALQRTFPQVESFVRTINSSVVTKYGSQMYIERRFMYADSAFFKMFSFPLLKGDPKTALDAANKMVITQSMATKYFGSDDPIGKTISVGWYGPPKNFEVTGVAADAPENSQIKFDFIGSFSSIGASKHEEWFTANYITYLLLKNKDQLPGFQQQLNTYMKGVSSGELKLAANSPLTYNLEPLLRVHLHSPLDGLEPSGNATTVYVLGVIALLILIIACINYTNLATVQSGAKSTEIGIRKVLGAQKSQLFGQFIGESFLLTLIALVFAVVLAIVFLPYYNQLTGKQLSFMVWVHPLPILVMLALCVFIAFASGSYPAFILSNVRLISILKSGLRLSSSGGFFRQALIVIQFTVSVALIIATVIVVQQLNFIRHKDLGYDKEHVIVITTDDNAHRQYEALKMEMARMPGVTNVSGANAMPTSVQWGDGITADDGHGKKELNISCLPSDVGLIKTLNMKLIAGADFNDDEFKLMDTAGKGKIFKYSFILNETAAKGLGWTPQQAIGKTVIKGAPGIVVGVIKDFHFASLHQPIGPMMMFLDTAFTNYILLKTTGQNVPATLQALQTLWKARVPSMPFTYRFLDDNYNSMYQSEQKTAAMFTTFSTLAILLACMGLFALSAFTTAQRAKEIGIRKVLGADVAGIVGLIAKDFLKLTLIAVLVASPLAWYFMNHWLQDFAYRINVNAWVFILAGGGAIVIAFITVSFQAIKAALANLVNSLRSE
ncbi:ABC transporter permease [Mucilaginibacter sp.]|uniref:ABC transporter permease n=1 Tax=Mucilaginibacter sp. TaxID=1882438 RepID=UPI0028522126|nr:ABC transporter permease [Mucilaginibacter sp.]MDR3693663.1 ABC transporter permease [Mucilaginibacter sp.]